MTTCDACGRAYPSPLEAAICGEWDWSESEDRSAGAVYRSLELSPPSGAPEH